MTSSLRPSLASSPTRRLLALVIAAVGCTSVEVPTGRDTIPAATMVWFNSVVSSFAQTALDDENVFVLDGSNAVYALEKATGQVRWKTILPRSFGLGLVIVSNVLVVGSGHAF